MNEKTFVGDIERLRRPERVAALEVPRVVDLCLDNGGSHTLLDIGCGSGIFLEAFAARGLFCASVDLNPAMLGATRRFVSGARVAAAIAESLPFAAKTFDVVFLAHILHEVDNPAIALAECGRVARHRIAVLEWPFREQEMGPPLLHRLSPEALGSAIAKAGLEKVRPVQLTAMSLYLIEI
jgi:ubiquinone/menaquinone biosynthesis C-methylase UbiE